MVYFYLICPSITCDFAEKKKKKNVTWKKTLFARNRFLF